jgi:hypothetical protein
MLSTNQKAKMINQELHDQNNLIPLKIKDLSDLEFIFKNIDDALVIINAIKMYYSIDAKKSTLIAPGLIIIDPVKFDEQIDIKFNELSLKEN